MSIKMKQRVKHLLNERWDFHGSRKLGESRRLRICVL